MHNIPHTAETKKKLSLAMKGKYKGSNHPMYGRKHTKATRKKISLLKKGKAHKKYCCCACCADKSGKNHPLYGKHHTQQTKDKIGKANSINKNADWFHTLNPRRYYSAIHNCVNKKYGKANRCDSQNCNHTSSHFEWCNRTHLYSYPLIKEEWVQMCRPCHFKYDYRFNNRTRTRSK